MHTQYSLLDGAARVSNLIDQAKKLGMSSIAITDHGIMYGTIEQDDLEREYAELMKYEKLNRIIAAVHADKPIYFGGFGLDIDDSYEIEKYEAEWLNYVEMHFVD